MENTNTQIIKPTINKIIKLFLSYRLVKACNIQTLFRSFAPKTRTSHLHYHTRFSPTWLVCMFQSLENYKQRLSDSCSLSEPNPVGHSKYQVFLNYWQTDIGFRKFAYRLYQSLIQSSHNLASGASFIRKVTSSIQSC
jgi:hypothetical protein